MRSVVIGGGEIATALSLALAANGRLSAMQLRDPHSQQAAQTSRKFEAFRRAFDVPPTVALNTEAHSKQTPRSAVSFVSWGDGGGLLEDMPVGNVYVAVPCAALTSSGPASDGATQTSCMSVPEQVAAWLPRSSSSIAEANTRQSKPAVVVMSRGLTRNGETPACALGKQLTALGVEDPLSILVASTTALPKEWAADSASTLQNYVADQARLNPIIHPSLCTLVMAATPSSTLEARGKKWFHREQVTMFSLDGGDASEALGFVNAAALLTAFGAGVLSHAYPGSVSALGAYIANATESTQQIVSGFLNAADATTSKPVPECPLEAHLRKATAQKQVPCFTLPPSVTSTLVTAALNQSSREFALGRQLRTKFKQDDALRATFGRLQSPHAKSLDDTMEGFAVRMAASKTHSPFFESIIDAYNTFRRVEDVGRQLVSMAACGNTAAEELRAQSPNSFLSKLCAVDAAVESGVGFEEATKDVERVFQRESAEK